MSIKRRIARPSLRRAGVAAALAIASTAIALAGLEVVVRGSGAFSEARALSRTGPTTAEAAPRGLLHPFLGWSIRPGTREPEVAEMLRRFYPDGPPADRPWERIAVNAQGFFSGIADYRELGADRIVVGIVGGSVADLFANTVGPKLAQVVASASGVRPERVAVISLAAGGYKQPQQVMAFAYARMLGIRFDFVINIDGFNEIALGTTDCEQGHHPVFPSREHLATLTGLSTGRASLWSMRTALRVAEAKANARGVLTRAGESWWGRSELARAVAGLWSQRQLRRAGELEQKLQRTLAAEAAHQGALAGLPVPEPRSAENCRKLAAELWSRGSRLLADLARGSGARYFHFLQPNQYVADSRPLTAEEKGYAWQPDHPWSRNAAAGYPELLREGAGLRRAGIAFGDLTGLFRAERGSIYIDTCCHFNLRGNEMLLGAVSAAIRREPGRPLVDVR